VRGTSKKFHPDFPTLENYSARRGRARSKKIGRAVEAIDKTYRVIGIRLLIQQMPIRTVH